jgi:thiol reductant ABC exporter CydC subunit
MSPMRRALGLLRPASGLLALATALGALAIGSGVGLMAVSAYLISRAAIATSVADIALIVTAVRVLAITRAAFRYFERYVSHRATFRVLANVRTWTYAALEPLAPAGLGDRHSGDLLARIVKDVDTLEDLPIRVVMPPLVAAIVVAVVTVVMGVFSPLMGLVLLAFLAFTGIILPWLTRQLARGPGREVIAIRAELETRLVDLVQGLPDLVAADLSARHLATIAELGDRLDRAAERLALLRGIAGGAVALLASLSAVCLLAIAIPMVTDGAMEGVFLALVPLVAITAFEAVQPLALGSQLLDATRDAAARLFELADAPAPVADPPSPAPAPVAAPGTPPAIEVRGLRFAYGDDPPVLDGLDLFIPAGGSVALTGASGAGKTTLVSLLLRFRQPGGGTITVGGVEVTSCAADELRALIGVVPQDVHLFNGTIRDNLAVAKADATDEEMVAACRIAQLHDAITALPEGYATVTGEGGALLSGGERQRLAIARAILKDAPILVLDEATANLDTETEARVMEALEPWMAGRTVLIVSHRPAVLARADRIVELPAPA